MINEARELAREWLQKRDVDVVLGLKRKEGHVGAHLFTGAGDDDLRDLELPTTHRVSFTCRLPRTSLLAVLLAKDPAIRIGVIARGCEERSFIELAKREGLDLGRVKVLGVACTEEDARACRCERPYPAAPLVGAPVTPTLEPEPGFAAMSADQRLELWKAKLSRCIKCFGCRNVCPVCACKECKMEQCLQVPTGALPPEGLAFHLIRLFHISEKCVGCGECERTCPVGMPLATIARQLKQDMKELFSYEAGLDVAQPSPLLLTLDVSPLDEEAARFPGA